MRVFLVDVFRSHWVSIVIFCVSLLGYGIGTSASVIQGDSGEFLAVAATSGIAHAPGFPLYSLILSLIFSLTHSAWWVNLTSGFFAAVTLSVVYLTMMRLTKHMPSALFAVSALGTYEIFWFYAQAAQIHMIFVCLLAILFYTIVLLLQTKNIRYWYLLGFLCGLGVSTHQVIILLAPTILLTMYFFRSNLSWKKFLFFCLFAILGLVPYLYIFIAAAKEPLVNWGSVKDTESFLHLFFRKDYGMFLLSKKESGAPLIYSATVHYWMNLLSSSWYVFPLFFLGCITVWKKEKIALLLFCSFLCTGPLYYFLVNIPVRSVVYQATIEQYMSYSFLFFSLLAGIGFFLIQKKYQMPQYILLGAVAIFFLILVSFTFEKVRLDTNTLVLETTKLQLESLPKNSILLTWSDSIYMPATYLQTVEKFRTDITVVQLGLLQTPWYITQITKRHSFLSKFFTKDDFVYTRACETFGKEGKLFIYPRFIDFTTVFGKNCSIIPFGLVQKVSYVSNTESVEMVKMRNDQIWNKYTKRVDLNTYQHKSTRTREALYYLSEQWNEIGVYYMSEKKDAWAKDAFARSTAISPDTVNALLSESVLLYRNGQIEGAIALLETGMNRNPATVDLYKNLGLMEGRRGNEKKAYEYLQTYLEFSPIDKDTPAIANFVTTYKEKQKAQSL